MSTLTYSRLSLLSLNKHLWAIIKQSLCFVTDVRTRTPYIHVNSLKLLDNLVIVVVEISISCTGIKCWIDHHLTLQLYTSIHTCIYTYSFVFHTHLASRNLERRIMMASQVLCLSCIWIELNLWWMMFTMRSISFGEMGRVRDCSLSRFITWVVNSLQA